jgi:hypothetical protein
MFEQPQQQTASASIKEKTWAPATKIAKYDAHSEDKM